MDIPKRVDESEYDEASNDFDQYADSYGKTPPRTRILRKSKEKRQKDFNGHSAHPSAKPSPKMVRPKKPIHRRNTVNVMFDELMAKAENTDADQGKRTDKRSMKLLRGSERDLKLDIGRAQINAMSNAEAEVGVEIRNIPPKTPQPSVQVEGCKQFKSLSSRRVPLNRRQVRSVSGNFANLDLLEIAECPPSRVEFHKTLSILVRMGCGDKQVAERGPRRNLSREEHLWQNELKDLIWLELQAWHASRSVTDEDNYLCMARDSVGNLLTEIMLYRFRRRKKRLSAHSQDSGVVVDDCPGCLSMYCQACIESQNEAMRDVEELNSRLEVAESLFPSSKAMAEMYPLYESPEFVGRVKAMCLWYNMTRDQRLKIAILGRLLASLANKYYQWPLMASYDGSSMDSSSPSDSNSSNSSSNEYFNEKTSIDIYTNPIPFLVSKFKNDTKTSPYRKYIENILKTRGLAKSMHFLEKLYDEILYKAQLTLEEPKDDTIFSRIPEDSFEEELKRYGAWSPEALSLDLPPYKSLFLFLSAVPLKVLHEFLQMRLEQKPKNPSPLSVRQLMRELKEGIKIVTKQRERILTCFHVALRGTGKVKNSYVEDIDSFDASLLQVFEDYLDYLGQWALLQHDTFQKNLLEEEWKFICEVFPYVMGGWKSAITKITTIVCSLVNSIGERLTERIEDLALELPKEDDENLKTKLFTVCRELQCLFIEEREMSIKTIGFAKSVIKKKDRISVETLDEFKKSIVSLKCTIPNAIKRVQEICDVLPMEHLDEGEKAFLASRCREILLQGYQFGFDFHKEMSDFVTKEGREKLTRSMVQFAHLWMKFTKERCERGRGKRPRWAYQGLEFLLTVCEPQNTRYLTEEEFEDLKRNMDACISHVIGTTGPSTPESGYNGSPKLSVDMLRPYPRSRGSSPSPKPAYRSQRSNRKASMDQSPIGENTVDFPVSIKKCDSLYEGLIKMKSQCTLKSERLLEAVETLDAELDKKLQESELIGHVISCNNGVAKTHIRRRHVTFSWQRGIKIGQGRFGKVYTAVNNNTGEMMAVKEIALQPNDLLTIRKVTEEIKIFEGISHRNLVRYYGLEVHKEEMLIFMEFCPEGTLESLVAGTEEGLPEELIRKYAYQLVSGIAELHAHSIVHRDIKTANIFLTEEGNCLKIGDFGCAVKIKSHQTMPGELQGFIGTQAYMAPEMFMQTSTEGHGRAADIWSAGCVIVEMATGKRPWPEFDSNYQIMFKVGMGDRPEAPDSLIDEGHDFLDKCLQHNPRDRYTAAELLDHNFVKAGNDNIMGI